MYFEFEFCLVIWSNFQNVKVAEIYNSEKVNYLKNVNDITI